MESRGGVERKGGGGVVRRREMTTILFQTCIKCIPRNCLRMTVLTS